ncbi:MAG: hypothetical protein KJO67_10185, partial [Silicimonas sp.]|nr:hypothetical protein [Silicimonas sp.]
MKKLTAFAVAAATLTVYAAPVSAQDIFALVPKNMNNPFFDQARDGCKKAEAESNGAFMCEYIGPGEHGGGDERQHHHRPEMRRKRGNPVRPHVALDAGWE